MRFWTNTADKLAIGLSVLCTIHCLLLPILLFSIPTISGVLAIDDEMFHRWLLFAVIPISLFAVIAGYIHHKNYLVSLISSTGMAVLIVAAVFGHDIFGDIGEVLLTAMGSLLVAYGHLRNLRLRCDNPKSIEQAN